MLGHKISHSNFKKIEITSSIFSNHNNMKLVINYKGEKKKPAKKISNMEVKGYATIINCSIINNNSIYKESMDQLKNSRRNQRIPRNKCK